ncbi:amidotransferase, partial [candidate division KSB1 bacterium]
DYTFDMPEGAVRIAENRACTNQAFEYNDGRVVALQFHPEFTDKCIRDLVMQYGDNMGEGEFVQPKEEILAEHCLVREIDALIDLLMNNMTEAFGGEF